MMKISNRAALRSLGPLGRRGLMAGIAVGLLAPARALANAPPVGSEDYEILAPFAEWIRTQDDAQGHWCCDISDGRIVQARTVRTGQDDAEGKPALRWQVLFLHPETLPAYGRPEGWQDVEDSALVRDKQGRPVVNPTGIDVAWWLSLKEMDHHDREAMDVPRGKRGYVRCFCPASAG